MVVIGLIGATLLYGDGCITPAISVLSAIEGIKVDAPQMEHAVIPLTVVILALLFLIQRNGTAWIGGIFGPVMLVWFVVAGALGIGGIARRDLRTANRSIPQRAESRKHLSHVCF
jgi:KUP system potassium uptake protein